jgi:SAM-dependent methyltransferase
MVPPRRMSFIGAGDFLSVGRSWVRQFIELGDLKPHERVLDVGCGLGRMAVPLTEYLTPAGSYEGIDVSREGIDWCMSQISSRFSNFTFRRIDIHNDFYSPRGRHSAAEYRFPFASDSFDFAFLTSVFTHMMPEDVRNYLGEVARVLKPEGRCLITFYILNDESQRLIGRGKARFTFAHRCGACSVENKAMPEAAVAFEEATIRTCYRERGLIIREPVYFGGWCGRPSHLHQQDFIVALKSPQTPP